MNSYVVNLYPKPNDTNVSQTITVAATTVSFADNFEYKTNACFFTVQTAPVIVTFDGTVPTASNGHVLAAGYTGWFSAAALRVAKFVRSGITSATITMSQFTT
jgi:hypothetical protein